QHSTRDALVERRVQDAHPVRERLDRFVAGMDPRQRAALISQPLSIPAEHLDGWMRTLAALRLVVASRLGIAISDDHEFTDPRFHLYDWLGYRLDELIRLADERDAMES